MYILGPDDADGYFLKPRLAIISSAPPIVRELWDYVLNKARFKAGDFDGLMIGQLKSSMVEIRNDLSWKSGFRVETYSDRQVKKAIVFLIENGLIIAERKHHKVTITILNYTKFQDSGKYRNTEVQMEVQKASHGGIVSDSELDNDNSALDDGIEDRRSSNPLMEVQMEVKNENPTIYRERMKNECIENTTSVPKQKNPKLCPQKKITDLYHSILPELPRIKFWGNLSQKNLRARWNQSPEFQTLDFWTKLFYQIKDSIFLTGKKTDFIANLSWVVRPQNFEKILNGNYVNRSAPIIKGTTAFEERVISATKGFEEMMTKKWSEEEKEETS